MTLFEMEAEYKIIGGDGAEYGPATLDELKSWIGDGRVAGGTQVWRSDIALWWPAARYAELQQALSHLQASLSPVGGVKNLRSTGFWPRLGAWFIDRAAVFILVFAAYCQWNDIKVPDAPDPMTAVSLQAYFQQSQNFAQQISPYAFLGLVCYEVLFYSLFSATPGKMLIGAKVIDVNGRPPGFTRSLLRSLAARFVELMLCVGYVWIIVHPEKRGVHDLMAGTRVVYRR